MDEHFIAFWNVENLFDVATSPHRSEKLKKQLKGELKGWTAAVLDTKLGQLAKVVGQMNGGAGPDILGVCEVENRPVLDKLAARLSTGGRTYGVAHADAQDSRGIDVAFLFDSARYQVAETFQHFVQKRTATRDIFQANVTMPSGRTLVLVGNHWPARRGSQYDGEPYRMMAGETLAYFHKRIREELGRDTAILAMGDFNDEPFDRSVREYAQATRERQKVMKATTVDYFYNLMWEILGRREATYYFGSQPNLLDQFWVSRGVVKSTTPFNVKPGSVAVFRAPEMVASGAYPRARPFGRPSKKSTFDPTGFADHFPITMVMTEKAAS